MNRMEGLKFESIGAWVRKSWLPLCLLLLLGPMVYTGPHILFDAENPEGNVPNPLEFEASSDGFLLIILDGVGEDFLFDEQMMPLLNSKQDQSSLLSVRTGPLTLSATCISELMTGVPNSPIDGMNNFDLNHPGGDDPWTLAAKSNVYSVGLVGSYVMGNLYDGMEGIEFENTFQGNSDYHEGDELTSQVLNDWLDLQQHSVISAHFSGPDKVGHKWGTTSHEYEAKLRSIDSMVYDALERVPERWTVMVTADHGMTEIGSHGSAEDVTRNVGAFLYGPDIAAGTSASIGQRDLTALTAMVLDLPFPIQLNGQIPLDVLNITVEQKEYIEQWNWDAAYQRQVFVNELNGKDSNSLSESKVDWNLIYTDGVFVRTSDIAVSLSTWFLLGFCSIFAVNPRIKSNPSEIKFLAAYLLILSAFVMSNASLWYSAMIPRAFGAASAVWVVAWALGGSEPTKSKPSEEPLQSNIGQTLSKEMFDGFRLWIAVAFLLSFILGSLSQSIVITCMLWVLAWCFGGSFNLIDSTESKLPSYAPWLLAFATFTFGSIRLWFVLLPFFFIVLRILFLQYKNGFTLVQQTPLLTLSALIFASLIFVHKRIFGTHYMLLFVQMGWPENLQSTLFSITILSLAAVLSTLCIRGSFDKKHSTGFAAVLLTSLAVSGLESNLVDRIALLLIAGSYLSSLLSLRFKLPFKHPEHLALYALSAHVVLIWGAWSAAATLAVLVSIGPLWDWFKPYIPSTSFSLKQPRPTLILAVLPWIVWVLWWTLLGQVNGVQTCFEGICPHPRELDFGRVVIRGGTIGFRDDPSNLWMGLMVALPLFIASTMMMLEFSKRGMSLRPYAISQFLIILGSMSILAFSPSYPRLMFSLAWNMTFAFFQFIFAVVAVVINRQRVAFAHNEKGTSPLRD